MQHIRSVLRLLDEGETIRLITEDEEVLYEGSIERLTKIRDYDSVRNIKFVNGVPQLEVDIDVAAIFGE